MLRFVAEQWDKNKYRLEEDIRKNLEIYNTGKYRFLVKKVVELILNDENAIEEEWDVDKIVEIDHGEYQGILLYLIPRFVYLPSENDYLMTYVGYGSCSGCDTLLSIQSEFLVNDTLDEEEKQELHETAVKEYMQLCLHILQNMTKPYNHGWRYEERFEHIENK